MERTYRDKVRFYTFWLQIERIKVNSISGAFAELGVYQGETARLIHAMNPERDLYLFDTFDGFRQSDLALEKSKDEKYNTSNFSDTSLAEVRKFINGNDHVKFHPGYFPDSAAHVDES